MDVLAPNRIYFIYLINEFRISLYPEWQIDNGFFKGPIIVHTQILVHRWGPTTRISVVPVCGVEIAVFKVAQVIQFGSETPLFKSLSRYFLVTISSQKNFPNTIF